MRPSSSSTTPISTPPSTGLIAAKFRNGGQTCVCPNRVYVQSGVYERFADLLATRVAALKVAPATDPDAQIGPMINARAIDKIARHVDDAVRTRRTRARRRQAPDRRSARTTTRRPCSPMRRATMQLSCEETFGPVVPLFRFDDEAEAIRAANDTPFGLASYFYSHDVRRIERVARRSKRASSASTKARSPARPRRSAA